MKLQVNMMRFFSCFRKPPEWKWEDDIHAAKYLMELWGIYPLEHHERALNVGLMRSVNVLLEVDDEAKNFVLLIDKSGDCSKVASGTIDHETGSTKPTKHAFFCRGKDIWHQEIAVMVRCQPSSEPSVVVEK